MRPVVLLGTPHNNRRLAITATVVHTACVVLVLLAIFNVFPSDPKDFGIRVTYSRLVYNKQLDTLFSEVSTAFVYRPVYVVLVYFATTAAFQTWALYATWADDSGQYGAVPATNQLFAIDADEWRGGPNVTRWVEYMITSSLMFMLVSSFAGVEDIISQMLLFVGNVVIMVTGWDVERRGSQTKQGTYSGAVDCFPLLVGTGIAVSQWTGIAFALGGSVIGAGDEKVPWFVFAIFFSYFFFFQLVPINVVAFYYYDIMGIAGTRERYERNYLILSLASKFTLGAFVAVGLFQPTRNRENKINEYLL
jgi:hypothetical protein